MMPETSVDSIWGARGEDREGHTPLGSRGRVKADATWRPRAMGSTGRGMAQESIKRIAEGLACSEQVGAQVEPENQTNQ